MGINFSNPLSVGGVYWAVGKLRILEQNSARWCRLMDSFHSSICTCDLQFNAAFLKKIILMWAISVDR